MLDIGSSIKDKYSIINKLGEGNMSHSFLCVDDNNKKYVIKTIELKGIRDWKLLELFERGAQVLEKLNHPNIPKYVDYFTIEKEDNVIYFLVYEYIEGNSLSVLVDDKGVRFSYNEIKDILIQLLEILDYLHSLLPPVIHRDINPNNIIITSDREIYLVDFGAVQEDLINTSKTLGGSTFVGTVGYMPLEQMHGKACPQSDIYALGMTAIKLLTGKNPNDFESENLKPVYKELIKFNDIDRVIYSMIEPDLNKRAKTPKELIKKLKDGFSVKKKTNSTPIMTQNRSNNRLVFPDDSSKSNKTMKQNKSFLPFGVPQYDPSNYIKKDKSDYIEKNKQYYNLFKLLPSTPTITKVSGIACIALVIIGDFHSSIDIVLVFVGLMLLIIGFITSIID